MRWYGLVVGIAALASTSAHAAGFFLAPRGVRALAQGGAFVAGATDGLALSYNPAGLAQSQDGVSIDAGLPLHETQYQRVVRPDGAPERLVVGQGLGLPSPTIALVEDFGLVEGLRFGAGMFADYPLLQNWPSEPDAPQRYAVQNYDGTLIFKLAAGAAYQVNEWLALGASVQLFLGNFAATTTVSACDGTACTQPENPDYDVLIQMAAKNIVAPGVQVGVLLAPTPFLRFGLAWETGYTINKEASLNIRLPAAPLYDGATVTPAEPTGVVRLRLPMNLRAGIELFDATLGRVELAFVYEPWSVHDVIGVKTNGIVLRDVNVLGDYAMADVDIERGFRDTYSVRLGGELVPPFEALSALRIRLGAMYEPSAVPPDKLTAMTVDLDKVLVTAGVSYAFGALRLDATYAHVFLASESVRDGSITQVNPTRPPWSGRTPIGNGDYAARASVLGLGATYAF